MRCSITALLLVGALSSGCAGATRSRPPADVVEGTEETPAALDEAPETDEIGEPPDPLAPVEPMDEPTLPDSAASEPSAPATE